MSREIASLHHLAATGGTIISKCIAAMRSVYLLSELHPFRANSVRFDPMAVVAQFQAQYGVLSAAEMKAAFLAQVEIVARCAQRQQHHLVLRDHSHTDFCARSRILPPNLLITLREAGFRMNAVATIRDPVESYVSMLNYRWTVLGFDDYCKRWLAFVNCYGEQPIYLYEDFCKDPDGVIAKMCGDLRIPFDPEFRSRLANRVLTGDSGRRSDEIAVKAPKPVPPELLRDIVSSEAYAQILSHWPAHERSLA